MSQDNTPITPLVDQILEKTFDKIRDLKEFDEATLIRLAELVESNDLVTFDSIVTALTNAEEE